MYRRTFDSAIKSLNIKRVFSGFAKFNKFTPMRGFATVNLDGVKNILKSEINHEETNYSPVDQSELKTFFNNTKFQFVDNEDNTLNLELKKTHGNYDVLVNFQAKPPIPQEEQNQEGEDKMPESMTEFTVRIIKKGGKSGLLIDASSMDTAFEFNTIQYSEDVNGLYADYFNQKAVDVYTGPSFNSLDERLQSEFTDFLTSMGVNEELMSFMNVMSVDKDQRLYLRWLKNVEKFFS